MITKRNPVSTVKPIWTDAQEVSDEDLNSEQNYNDVIQSSNIVNHIGNGILPQNLNQNSLFESSKVSGLLDGKPLYSQSQPSDNVYGNQLQIELSSSLASGNRSIKVAIIGLDFNNSLQYETFVFKSNEIQVSKKHFTQILLVLTNDLLGQPSVSLNLGGILSIKEAQSFYLSRDVLSVSQDIEPNLFFRDFFLDGFISLQAMLQTALPFYDIDNLNIFTGEKNRYTLSKNDVITQIGQKFLSTSDNIQKITLLMSLENSDNPSDEVWNGDLVVSVYELQSSLACSTDLSPNLDIEFSPSSNALSQISVNYTSLLNQGYKLNSVPQPIDFVFSNTSIANKNGVSKNSYYAICIKRQGSANKSDIIFSAGSNRSKNSRITTFTGSIWVDLPEEDLWFQVWSDAAKITDGQAYENGHGVILPKIIIDPETQSNIDYSLGGINFAGGNVYNAILTSTQNETEFVADQRTGDPLASRKENVPLINLINDIELTSIKNISDPLVIGSIVDKNIKYIDSSNSTISANLYSGTLVGNNLIIKIVDDSTDIVRFDSATNALVPAILNGNLLGSKLNINNKIYRICDATINTMIVGDINGDGVVDAKDLELFNYYNGYDLNKSLPLNSSITTDGTTTSFENGYIVSTNAFKSESSLSFQIVNSQTGAVLGSANDGYLLPNAMNASLSSFGSSTFNFSSISNLTNYKLVIISSLEENKGAFTVVSNNNNVLTLNKILLNSQNIFEMLRADVDGDFNLSSNDGYLIQNYINKNNVFSSSPYPGPTTNAYTKIGTKFNAILIKLEKFLDRHDDYSSTPNTRSLNIHPIQDILFDDLDLQNRDYYNDPLSFSIEKQLVWYEDFVISNSNLRFVSATFENSNQVFHNCEIVGVETFSYKDIDSVASIKNDYYFPNNLILNNNSQLILENGDYFKIDFEVGTIIMEVPDSVYGTEQSINLLDSFVADYTGDGITRLGFPAMKFADCSSVGLDALDLNQVRFSVSVQSFSPNLNGITSETYEGVVVDGKIGVSVDYSTGLLSLNFSNLFEDSVLKTLNTKIQIQVFLKKAGFNNSALFVESEKIQNMLSLVSNYSGSGINNLVNFDGNFIAGGDLSGTSSNQSVVRIQGRPVSSSAPSLNQVLQWNGSAWIPATVASGGGGGSSTIVQDGANYSNTLNIAGFTNTGNTSSNTYVVGATFEFDKSSFKGAGPGIRVINLKIIAETTGPQMSIQLLNVTTSTVVTGSTLTTSSVSPALLTSGDLTAALSAGSAIYQVQIKMDTGSSPDRVTLDYAGMKIVWS